MAIVDSINGSHDFQYLFCDNLEQGVANTGSRMRRSLCPRDNSEIPRLSPYHESSRSFHFSLHLSNVSARYGHFGKRRYHP